MRDERQYVMSQRVTDEATNVYVCRWMRDVIAVATADGCSCYSVAGVRRNDYARLFYSKTLPTKIARNEIVSSLSVLLGSETL